MTHIPRPQHLAFPCVPAHGPDLRAEGIPASPASPPRPLLIAFEGVDATGKSSLVHSLMHDRWDNLPNCTASAEPYLRETRETVATLTRLQASQVDVVRAFTMDRAYHVATEVGPALARSRYHISQGQADVLLLDRYYLSTSAYQGDSHQEAADLLHDQAAMFPVPDLWVICHADRATRAARLCQRVGRGHQSIGDQFCPNSAPWARPIIRELDNTEAVHARMMGLVNHLTRASQVMTLDTGLLTPEETSGRMVDTIKEMWRQRVAQPVTPPGGPERP